jgi:hypothetical protein
MAQELWRRTLMNATQEQRDHWEPSGGGYRIHWPDLDEDLRGEGLARGSLAPKSPFIEAK